jgi:hypothetical protein
MTKEEIIAAMKTEDGKAVLESLLEPTVKGLKSKNEELLEKLKKEKDSKTDIESRLEGLEEKKREAEEKAAEKSGDFNKLKEQLETRHNKEVEKLQGEKKELIGKLDTHVLGNGLTEALVKAKIRPEMMGAAKALIRQTTQGEVGDNDGTPFAKFDGKAVDEFVTGWSQSDEGKHFVSADQNSGGGSNGANGKGKAGTDKKSMTRDEFQGLSAVDRMTASKEGITLTDE